MKPVIALFLISVSLISFAQTETGSLLAVYEENSRLVKLKWQHLDKQVKGYQLQKSIGENQWVNLQQFAISIPHQFQLLYYKDENPAPGKNYYRLKLFLSNGAVDFTQPILAVTGKPGNNWLMYPVPVKDVLNLQYNGSKLITGVVNIEIKNIITGMVFHRLRMASTNRHIQIPVNNLGKGRYSIKIIIDQKLQWSQQFVK